jgi:ABC-type transport system substrate-binding protein
LKSLDNKAKPSETRVIRGLLALLILLSGCGGSESPDVSASLKVYRHSIDGTPGSLDPAHAGSVYAKFLAVNLYDTLYRYRYLARPYQITANLAEGLPEISEDGLVYTISIRKGVKFSDDPVFIHGKGRELTADDFVYSIKRHFDPATISQGAWLWQDKIVGLDKWKENGSDYDLEVAGLKAIDRHTVRIELKKPFPQLIHTFAQGFSGIVPHEAVSEYGREFSNHPVGSGPFTLSRVDSASAVLEPNPYFRRDPFSLEAEGYNPDTQGHLGLEVLEGRSPPFIDRLHIDFIAEDAARWNAFTSNDIHFIRVPASQFDRVLASRDPVEIVPELAVRYRFDSSLESGFVYTNFNLDDERIGYHPDPKQNQRNKALRCAIIKGFDWQSRNEVFYYGIGRVFPGIIPPVTAEFDVQADRAYVERYTDQAKKLLLDHEWDSENLPTLEYGFPASVTERQMFEQFRAFMLEIGYPGEKIRPVSFATFGDYYRAYSRREVMLITSSWTMDYPDAENTMQLYFGPNSSPGSNSSNYNNERFDELYRRSAVMQPSGERTGIYREMNQLVIEDCATISGIARNLLFLWNRNAIMLPDRSFVSGYFLRFVDIIEPLPGNG